MSMVPGTRVGPYEIVSPLGAGGMGEVYRARDARLDRDVAIKILPELFAQDPERLARFEREAKALAALNHPNIAAIFGIESGSWGPGVPGSSNTQALVMELVEGEACPRTSREARCRSPKRCPSRSRSLMPSRPRMKRASSIAT